MAFSLHRLLLLLCLLLGAAAAPVSAQSGPRMRAELVLESPSVAPGQEVDAAIVLRPMPGWHGYWKNPGDAGAEPRADWTLPAGWSAAPFRFPVPDRLTLLGLMNYVYKGDHALLTRLEAPADAAPGSVVPIRLKLDYLVCTDQLCVPETAELTAALRVGDPGAADPDFAAFRQKLPRPLGQAGAYERVGDRLRIAIPLPASTPLANPYFYALGPDWTAHDAAQSFSRSGDRLIVETRPARAFAGQGPISGVLEISDGNGLEVELAPGPVPPAGTPVAGGGGEAGDTGARAILLALVGSLIGGLLLNIMPCVFPILSLKAIGLARAGAHPGAARREALAYTAGIVLTCLALGAGLLALRQGGESVGWAFQLQDPKVIFLLLMLVTAIALNLAGLFHLPALSAGGRLAGSKGAGGAFFTGILAAFVATPCTGPFLGVALGAALVLPAWASLAVFAGLGLGLAMPFLLLAFVPALRNRLPRPGPWMETFQRILSVPMFATALGLAWILGRQSGVDLMALGLGAALLMGLALWWLGRGRVGAVLPSMLVAIAVLAPLFWVRPAAYVAQAASAVPGLSPIRFDEAELDRLRAENVPVFLYFTADWCLTCKVNERAALARDEVAAAFEARGVAVMEADWTLGDAAIGRFLERHGRSGVPLYLYYPRGGGEPEILPQILTVGRLTALGR